MHASGLRFHPAARRKERRVIAGRRLPTGASFRRTCMCGGHDTMGSFLAIHARCQNLVDLL
jgi:hypothetical protein